MAKVITDHDMRDQVLAALGTYADEHDVEGIVEEIHRTHGLVDIETVDTAEFWKIVERHDLVNVPPHRNKP
ncbi:MAG TPA: hypothetical protein VIU64_16930 [Polyangia bacterium]